MSTAKYVKVGGVWKPVTTEYVKIGGTWKPVLANYVKIGGSWKAIPVGEKFLFACEQFSDRLYGLDDTPTELVGWPKYGGGISDPFDVAADSDGNSYWASADGVRKVGIDGTIAWTYTGHGTSVYSVCVDADGYVYSGDYAGVVKKLTSGGSVVWSKSLGTNYAVYALAVDHSEGQLYAGTGFAKDAVYRLITSNGNSTLAYTCPYGDVSGIAIDEGLPSLYITTNAGYLMKISTAGYVYWGNGGAISTDAYNVRVGHDGYGYCATGAGGTHGKSMYKFDLTTGTMQWKYTAALGCAIGCAVDMFGNVYGSWYVAGTSTSNVIRKTNSAGVLQWSWQPYVSAQWRGVAVTPGARAAGF
jgi:hypothetical protein